MSSCLDFAAKKAIIFSQADYSLTKLLFKDIDSLPVTKNDAIIGKHLAHGFGIEDRDIIYIEDMNI